MRRDLKVIVNKITNYEICYGNQFHIKDMKTGYNIKSTGFNLNGITDTLYLGDKPDSNGKTGTVFLFKLKSPTEPIITSNNAGIINYEKGEIILRELNITNSSKIVDGIPYIQISTIPQSNDVIGKEDLYLQLDINNSMTNILDDSISSGADISGSSYTVTSSYSNGTYVRL